MPLQNAKKKGVEYLNVFSANTGIALPKSAEEGETACRNGDQSAYPDTTTKEAQKPLLFRVRAEETGKDVGDTNNTRRIS